MTQQHIGTLKIGDRAYVAGTITTYATLAAFADSERPDCDLVEVRLDLVGTDQADWLERCLAIEASGLPVLLTIRDSSEGGKWTGSDDARLALYEQALGSLSAVDIEARAEICACICRRAATLGKPVVVSFHDFESTPSLGQLKEQVATIREQPHAIPKIATMVQEEEDIVVLSDLLAESSRGPICVIGMGTMAKETRVSFAQTGSCLTYGFIDESSAPGQCSAAELVDKLR
jgi:3-dehydroquinate dehydratase-1